MSRGRFVQVALGASVVTAPIAVAVGCGGRLDTSSLDGGVASSAPTTTRPPKTSPPGLEVPPMCPAEIVFDEKVYDEMIGSAYKAPASPASSCTADELTTFESNMGGGGKTFERLRQGLGATCAACIFTRVTDATWGPIVMIDDRARGFVNFGGCHASIHGSADCGRAFQYDQFCVGEACYTCTEEEADAATCSATAKEGPCRSTHALTVSSCPKLAASEQQCGTTVGSHARYFCGP